MRTCPVCGKQSRELVCDEDQTPTLRVATCTAATVETDAFLDHRYLIQQEIGRGGVGRVFAAHDSEADRAVAVKVLATGAGDLHRDVAARFAREAAVTACLVDPHTVAMLDFGQTTNGELFTVMELLRGESLQSRLSDAGGNHQGLPYADVFKVAASALKSLREAHELGLVHRDVKPGNIVFHRLDNGEEAVKLIDFGMVHIAGSLLTSRNERLGTPTYMSPEQAKGMSVDARSDLYSLGCVLYTCLAGRPPFQRGGNPIAVLHAHVNKTPPPLRTLVPTAEPMMADLIERALAKEPDERFQSAAAMSRALRAVGLRGERRRRGTSLSGPKLPPRPPHPSGLTPAALGRKRVRTVDADLDALSEADTEQEFVQLPPRSGLMGRKRVKRRSRAGLPTTRSVRQGETTRVDDTALIPVARRAPPPGGPPGRPTEKLAQDDTITLRIAGGSPTTVATAPRAPGATEQKVPQKPGSEPSEA